jgi:hypothetical protein
VDSESVRHQPLDKHIQSVTNQLDGLLQTGSQTGDMSILDSDAFFIELSVIVETLKGMLSIISSANPDVGDRPSVTQGQFSAQPRRGHAGAVNAEFINNQVMEIDEIDAEDSDLTSGHFIVTAIGRIGLCSLFRVL